MDKRNFAFGRANFILLGFSMVVVVLGFILMSGAGSNGEAFNPNIFSPMRIKVAPVVCFLGFVSMVCAVAYRPKDRGQSGNVNKPSKQGKEIVGK